MVAVSTAKDEYMVLTEAVKEFIFLNRFFEKLGVLEASSGVIFCDSQSAILLAENPTHHVLSDEMIADIFTKPQGPIKHSRHYENLGLI